jgi:hypothetical protein
VAASVALGLAIVAAFALAVGVAASHSGLTRAAPPPPAGLLPQPQSPPPATRAPAQRPTAHANQPAPVATALSTFWGIDVSWPQCAPSGLPTLQTAFVVVGVNDGRPFTDNPCLAQQVAYAKSHSGYSAYLNLDAPRGEDPTTYGRRAALDGLARAHAAGLRPPTIWLDIEVLNHWADPTTNVDVINGALHALARHHVTAGIYSSVPMWQQITGGASVGVPVWLATSVTDYRTLDPLCAQGLGGRPAVIAQYVATTGSALVDVDVLCTATRTRTVGMFAAGRS